MMKSHLKGILNNRCILNIIKTMQNGKNPMKLKWWRVIFPLVAQKIIVRIIQVID